MMNLEENNERTTFTFVKDGGQEGSGMETLLTP